VADLALQRRRIRGFRLLIERGRRNTSLALLAQAHLRVRGHAGIEFCEPVAHRGLDFFDEFAGVLRCLQQIVIGLALGIEISRHHWAIAALREQLGGGSPNTLGPLLEKYWKSLGNRIPAGPEALERVPESLPG
jgi:hypothetical protein